MSENQALKDERVPDGTRLSSSTEPQEGLRPPGFDPSRETVRALTALQASFKEREAVTAFLMTMAARATYRHENELPRWAVLTRLRTRWTAACLVGIVQALENSEHHEDQARWLSEIGGSSLRVVPCDSDGSPEGGDACGSVHDSAGRETASPDLGSPTTIVRGE